MGGLVSLLGSTLHDREPSRASWQGCVDLPPAASQSRQAAGSSSSCQVGPGRPGLSLSQPEGTPSLSLQMPSAPGPSGLPAARAGTHGSSGPRFPAQSVTVVV